jgi:hypothetical protein
MASVRTVVQVSVSGTSALSSALTVGFRYVLSSSTDLYWKQGATGSTVTTGNGFFLKSGSYFEIKPTGADDQYVAAIQASASGTLTIARMEGE